MSTIFLEVVGGVANSDKAKHRKDTKKVLQAKSAAVQVQHLMVLNRAYRGLPISSAANVYRNIKNFDLLMDTYPEAKAACALHNPSASTSTCTIIISVRRDRHILNTFFFRKAPIK
ncbi:hypothetical protein DFS34DRAFT_645263 [Phlyctochytrium arcticum]|nr:hypothetical protein DFS34DRAFT_645263 [Phlyctochytrium arcticum]